MDPLPIIFALALACVLYAYAGYPMLLWAWRRLRPRPLDKTGPNPRGVSVVVAARNEAGVIARRVEELTRLIANVGVEGELIIVSDGSTDATADLASTAERGSVPVNVIVLRKSVGKAAAVSAGCRSARHDVIVLADARQTWAPDALANLLDNFADPFVGGVSGELVLESAPGAVAGVGLYWRYEKWIRQAESQIDSSVGVSGSICAVRRELFRDIPEGTILDDVYWPMQVVLQGRRVVLDNRAHAFDRLPAKAAAEFRRKVRTLSGNFQVVCRIPSLLLPWRNRLLVQFASHKLARLAVPWAMLIMLGVAVYGSAVHGAAGRGLLWIALLVAQLAFYAFGLLALSLGERVTTRLGSRLASTIASFLLLNAAAWVAFWIWITGRSGASWNKTTYTTPSPMPLAGATPEHRS